MISSVLRVIGALSYRLHRIARATILSLLALYQRYISPVFPARCRYYPSCSAYSLEAVRTHGVIKGLILTAWRLLRCNPMTLGGIDHVPDKGRWRYILPRDVPRFSLKQ